LIVPITTDINRNKDLTTFTATGMVTYAEQIAVLKEFYEAKPTSNVIWDLRELYGPRLSNDELEEIVLFVKKKGHAKRRGKTALVSTSDLDFGLSRMAENYAESENLPWQIQAFRTMAEALKWIHAPEEHPP